MSHNEAFIQLTKGQDYALEMQLDQEGVDFTAWTVTSNISRYKYDGDVVATNTISDIVKTEGVFAHKIHITRAVVDTIIDGSYLVVTYADADDKHTVGRFLLKLCH